jgi:hypothetical protein
MNITEQTRRRIVAHLEDRQDSLRQEIQSASPPSDRNDRAAIKAARADIREIESLLRVLGEYE